MGRSSTSSIRLNGSACAALTPAARSTRQRPERVDGLGAHAAAAAPGAGPASRAGARNTSAGGAQCGWRRDDDQVACTPDSGTSSSQASAVCSHGLIAGRPGRSTAARPPARSTARTQLVALVGLAARDAEHAGVLAGAQQRGHERERAATATPTAMRARRSRTASSSHASPTPATTHSAAAGAAR